MGYEAHVGGLADAAAAVQYVSDTHVPLSS
jgi:hypothetical protein